MQGEVIVNEFLRDYFHTDWAAMTASDWLGLLMTFITLLMMVALYWYVFTPSNKERLEAMRHIPTEEDFANSRDEK